MYWTMNMWGNTTHACVNTRGKTELLGHNICLQENVVPAVKDFGGSIMLWDCFNARVMTTTEYYFLILYLKALNFLQPDVKL